MTKTLHTFVNVNAKLFETFKNNQKTQYVLFKKSAV